MTPSSSILAGSVEHYDAINEISQANDGISIGKLL